MQDLEHWWSLPSCLWLITEMCCIWRSLLTVVLSSFSSLCNILTRELFSLRCIWNVLGFFFLESHSWQTSNSLTSSFKLEMWKSHPLTFPRDILFPKSKLRKERFFRFLRWLSLNFRILCHWTILKSGKIHWHRVSVCRHLIWLFLVGFFSFYCCKLCVSIILGKVSIVKGIWDLSMTTLQMWNQT